MFISFLSAFIIFIHFYLVKRMKKYKVNGFVKPGFEKVLKIYKDNFANGLERGSAFSAYYKGELVVSLFGGVADYKTGKLWQKDTCGRLHSCTKALGAICLAQLADKGLLDYNKPVSFYWPEFAANGKQDITVECLLSHAACLWSLDSPITVDEILTQPDVVSHKLANQKPLAKPGSVIFYHTITIGMYMDEIMKRIDPKHRNIKEYFEQEIAGPFGLDIGIIRREDQKNRRVNLYTNWLAVINLLNPLYYKIVIMIFNYIIKNEKGKRAKASFNVTKGLLNRTDIPCVASSGVGTTESLAKLYSLILEGKILSRKIIERLVQPVADFSQITTHKRMTFSLGLSPLLSPRNTWMMGSPGFGGQMAYSDPSNNISFAYLTNSLSPLHCGDDTRHLALQQALYKCI